MLLQLPLRLCWVWESNPCPYLTLNPFWMLDFWLWGFGFQLLDLVLVDRTGLFPTLTVSGSSQTNWYNAFPRPLQCVFT